MTVTLLNSCIMAGNYIIAAKLSCSLIETVKFKVLITSDTGIGGFTTLIAANKGLNNLIPKLSFIMINVRVEFYSSEIFWPF